LFIELDDLFVHRSCEQRADSGRRVPMNIRVMRGGDRNVAVAQVILRRALGTDIPAIAPLIGSRKRRSGAKSGAAQRLSDAQRLSLLMPCRGLHDATAAKASFGTTLIHITIAALPLSGVPTPVTSMELL
jgi:hypothetical protein